jgi:predicted RNA-binding Zn-ribbon protein involved in translation (DUF1610 family)
MTSLNISCDSCGSKLKVRDESLVGQIQICPKCGNMVLIQVAEEPVASNQTEKSASAQSSQNSDVAADPVLSDFSDAEEVLGMANPNSDSAPSSSSTSNDSPSVESNGQPTAAVANQDSDSAPDPTEETESPDDAPKQSPTPQQPKPESPSIKSPEQPQQRQRRPDDTVEDSRVYDDDAPSSFATISRPGPGEGLPLSDSEPNAPPLLPDGQWESKSVTQARQYLLFGIAAVVGVMLAIGVTVYFISRISPTPVANAADQKKQDDTPENASSGKQPKNSDSQDNPDSKSVNPVADTGADPGNVGTNPTADPITKPGEEPKDVPKNPLPTDTEDPAPTDGDPIGLTDPQPPEINPEDGPKPAANGGTEELLKDFWDFQGFLTDQQPFDGDQVASSDDAMQPLELEDLEPIDPLPRPAPWKVILARRLEDPITAVHFDKTPLHKLTDFLTDFSTIPIAYDTQSLSRKDVSVRHQVSMTLEQETKVKELLQQVLSPLGLQAVETGDQLRIIAIDEPATQKMLHEIGDLADTAKAKDELVQLLETLLAPEQWGEPAASLQIQDKSLLAIEGSPGFCQTAIQLCERLRLARGLPVATSMGQKLTLQPLRLQTEILDKKLDLNLVSPTPIRKVLDAIEKQTEVAILVDWQALADEDWNPAGENRLFAKNVSLGKALEDFLIPMELTYRFIEPDVLEVTTAKALSAMRQVQFHEVKELANKVGSKTLLTQLETALTKDGKETSPVTFVLDESSGVLISAGPENMLPLVDKLLQKLASQ